MTLNAKIGVFNGFFSNFGLRTHVKSGSIHVRWWRHLAYVNTSYPMSVAGIDKLDLFTVGLHTYTTVACSSLR